jgi:hypothetical protein
MGSPAGDPVSEGARSRSGAVRGTLFWPAVVVVWPMMIFGVIGMLQNAADTRPGSFILWFMGSELARDFLLFRWWPWRVLHWPGSSQPVIAGSCRPGWPFL